VLATSAYFLALAGLVAVAAAGSESQMSSVRIIRSDDRVPASGLGDVVEQVLQAAAENTPQP
jgi:hypothetical protein